MGHLSNTSSDTYPDSNNEAPLTEPSKATILALYAAGHDLTVNARLVARAGYGVDPKNYPCHYQTIALQMNQCLPKPVQMSGRRNRVYRHLMYWTGGRFVNMRAEAGRKLFLQDKGEQLYLKARASGLLPFIMSRDTDEKSVKDLHLYNTMLVNPTETYTVDSLASASGLLAGQVEASIQRILARRGVKAVNQATRQPHFFPVSFSTHIPGKNARYKLSKDSYSPFPEVAPDLSVFDVSPETVQTVQTAQEMQPKIIEIPVPKDLARVSSKDEDADIQEALNNMRTPTIGAYQFSQADFDLIKFEAARMKTTFEKVVHGFITDGLSRVGVLYRQEQDAKRAARLAEYRQLQERLHQMADELGLTEET